MGGFTLFTPHFSSKESYKPRAVIPLYDNQQQIQKACENRNDYRYIEIELPFACEQAEKQCQITAYENDYMHNLRMAGLLNQNLRRDAFKGKQA